MSKPVKMKRNEVAGILRIMADLIEAGDSFEGSIQYSCLDDIFPTGDDEILDMTDLAGDEMYMMGMYRIGNSMGQGGVNLIREET